MICQRTDPHPLGECPDYAEPEPVDPVRAAHERGEHDYPNNDPMTCDPCQTEAERQFEERYL